MIRGHPPLPPGPFTTYNMDVQSFYIIQYECAYVSMYTEFQERDTRVYITQQGYG